MPGWNRTTKTAKDTVEAFQVHFKAILNQDRNVDMDFVRQHLHQRPTQGILDEPISRKEVSEAVKSLKNCKSPGEDGIVNEVWKAHERLIDYLVEVSNQALEGDVPKEWVDCIIAPVHKKGPVNDPNNYRGITLLSTGGKVFGRVPARRLMQFVVPKVVSESQCGYQPGRSTEDLIFVMRQLFEKAREKNTPMYAVFVDFTKAFDSVVVSYFGRSWPARVCHPNS